MRVVEKVRRGLFSRLMYRRGWRGVTLPFRGTARVSYWCDTDGTEAFLRAAIMATPVADHLYPLALARAIGAVAHERSHVADAQRLGAWGFWKKKLRELLGGFRAGEMEARAYAAGKAAKLAAWDGKP